MEKVAVTLRERRMERVDAKMGTQARDGVCARDWLVQDPRCFVRSSSFAVHGKTTRYREAADRVTTLSQPRSRASQVLAKSRAQSNSRLLRYALGMVVRKMYYKN